MMNKIFFNVPKANFSYFAVTVLLALACLGFSSCGKSNKQTDTAKKLTADYIDSYCVSDDMLIFSEDDLLECFDLANKQKMVLCSKPNCTHESFSSAKNTDPTCNAVTPEGQYYSGLVLDGDVMYLFVDNGASTALYRYNYKDDTKEQIAELDFVVNGNVYLRDNKLIMAGWYIDTDAVSDTWDTSSADYDIYIYDLSSEKLTQTEFSYKFILAVFVEGDTIYYSCSSEEDGEIKKSTHSLDIATLEDTLIKDDCSIYLYSNNKAYYSTSDDEIYSLDMETYESEKIEGGYIMHKAYGDKLVYMDTGLTLYCLDTKTGGKTQCMDIDGGLCFMNEDYTVFSDSESNFYVISTDDFANGNNTSEKIYGTVSE